MQRRFLFVTKMWVWCWVVFLPAIVFGQEREPPVLPPIIIPDRPGIGDYSGTVIKGSVQFECGVGAIWGNPDAHGNVTDKLFYPNLLVRYGLLDNFELRCMVEYDSQRITEKKIQNDVVGLLPLDLGIKTTICIEDSTRPQLGLLAKCILPFWGQPEFRPRNIAPYIVLILDKTFSPLLSINANAGLFWNGNSSESTGIVTVNLDITPVENLTFFVEVYGYFPEKQDFGVGINAGAVYPIASNIQVDLSAGRRLLGNVDAGFVTAGVSWRLPQ